MTGPSVSCVTWRKISSRGEVVSSPSSTLVNLRSGSLFAMRLMKSREDLGLLQMAIKSANPCARSTHRRRAFRPSAAASPSGSLGLAELGECTEDRVHLPPRVAVHVLENVQKKKHLLM